MIAAFVRKGVWREAAWIALGQGVGALGAVVGVRLLTGVLTPETYGEFALGLTVAMLVSQVALGPLANGFERFFAPSAEAQRMPAYFAAIRLTTLRASTLVVLLGLAVTVALLALRESPWVLLTCGAVLFAVLSGWEGILDGIQNAARQRRWVALHQGLRPWLRPVAAVALTVLVVPTSGVVMFGFVFASMVVLISQAWRLRAMLHTAAAPADGVGTSELSRQMLAYATPFAMWGLFTWLQGSSDRWALQVVTSSSQVGLYAIVAQIGGYPLTLLGAMVYQVAGPIIYTRVGTGADPAGLRRAAHTCALLAAAIVGVTVVLVAIAAVAHRQIFDLLVAPEFRSVSVLLPIAVASAGLFNAGQILTLVPLASGNSRTLLAPKIGTAAVAVALNFGAAYLFGVAGVVTAGLIFALIFDAWMIWVAVGALKRMSGHLDSFGFMRADP